MTQAGGDSQDTTQSRHLHHHIHQVNRVQKDNYLHTNPANNNTTLGLNINRASDTRIDAGGNENQMDPNDELKKLRNDLEYQKLENSKL